MTIQWQPLIEGGIPVLGGLYATALGFGWLGQHSVASGFKQKLRSSMKWLGPLVVAFGLFTGWQAHQRAAHLPASELARSIAAKLSLPVQVDEITSLDAVDGAGNTITYHSSINATLQNEEERTRMKQLLEQQLHTFACRSPDMTKLLSAGYAIEWRYRVTGSGEEFSSVVDADACVRDR
ncbi:hypothetical protein [Peristeroidobacter agariperforans]|uniref:hypothetical protein n=1 Tax=Peristeroidobacter agariperforans TaxID=268404 RepID=UPI00101DD802|nr:hypothetical protein [Peristeroidobacter agariperforans]